MRKIDVEKLAAFDLETTGLDVTKDRIVTASIVGEEITNVEFQCEWLANPGVPISPEAEKVHGISNEYAESHGESHEKVVLDVARELRNLQNDGYTIVAQNAVFDISMLTFWIGTYGAPELDLDAVVDTMILDHILRPQLPKNKRRTLGHLAEAWGVHFYESEAHNSSYDAKVAWYVAREQLSSIPEDHMLHAALADASLFATIQRDVAKMVQRNRMTYFDGKVDSGRLGFPVEKRVYTALGR